MKAPSLPSRLIDALAGRYRVERELGAGGMATVYLAEDVKHSRKVAIKVLKPELAAVIGADRFVTEIKTTANLQHPHILPLFDSGEADTYLFYVMPFIEGESLRDRLDRDRQLGVDEAVRIARDVADALDYAHRHGVIHRDIKPANILLHDGRPLVADFGIALAISAAGGGRMTETGLSLGTPHYMSPEQASAERDLSARSDVYSLGCVLYEMLAGEPPHTGPNAAAILMRILTENPRALSEIRPTVPLHVAGAVAKAVEKLPADRFETARQFRDALEDPSFRFTRATTAAAAPVAPVSAQARERRWDARHVALAGAAVAFAATTAWLALQQPPPTTAASAEAMAFQIADSVLDAQLPFAGAGGWLAYVARSTIYIRPPGALQATPLAGADRLSDDIVSFSPDGESIVWFERPNDATLLRRSPTRAGNPVTVASLTGVAISPRWGDDGWIYFTGGTPGNWITARVPEAGGQLDTLFLAGGFIPFTYVKIPGHPTVAFTLFNPGLTDSRILALELEARDTMTIVPNGYNPEWSPTGHLLFARREGTLFAMPFDPRRPGAAGTPVPVLDSLAERYPTARYSVSPGGTLVYVAGRSSGTAAGSIYTLRLDNFDGAQENIPLPPSDHWDAKFSPDGRRLAYIRNDQVWVYDLDLGTHTQLTKGGSRHHNPAWSPDGERLVFSASAPGRPDVDVFIADARGKSVERFGGGDMDEFPSQWMPDSSVLVQTQGAKGEDILLVRRGAADVTAVLEADWQERNPRVSPDGRWLAYVSREGNRTDLYVRRWPSLQNKVKVSTGEGQMAQSSYPLWSNDSRQLIYHQGNQLVTASVDGTRDTLRITSRRVLEDGFRGILADLHPDGRRFLVMALVTRSDTLSDRSPRRMVVKTHWTASLRTPNEERQPE